MKGTTIITFANSKGGVGKTTLCIALANYLKSREYEVQIIDADTQRSIHNKRKSDIELIGSSDGGATLPYKVMGYSFTTPSNAKGLVEMLRHSNNISLVDMPGKSTSPEMNLVLLNSDYIIIPFEYEFMVLSATARFLKNLVEELRKSEEETLPQLILVPNLFNPNNGTKAEKEKFEIIRQNFSKFGLITPCVNQRVDMTRFSTLDSLDRQDDIVEAAFSTLLNHIFNNKNS